ncbi:hypothetical protein B0T10DRAFT_491002 [Thelonectria olida]|uniref:Uncharacterized protein n=1 Tax=Thelonectria olida TaxID=1576542 RepID=A0A9P9AN76_9HYPO|nr:hypothetical protein B0T10DRAFT_491002 [Thelonectria olida]
MRKFASCWLQRRTMPLLLSLLPFAVQVNSRVFFPLDGRGEASKWVGSLVGDEIFLRPVSLKNRRVQRTWVSLIKDATVSSSP